MKLFLVTAVINETLEQSCSELFYIVSAGDSEAAISTVMDLLKKPDGTAYGVPMIWAYETTPVTPDGSTVEVDYVRERLLQGIGTQGLHNPDLPVADATVAPVAPVVDTAVVDPPVDAPVVDAAPVVATVADSTATVPA